MFLIIQFLYVLEMCIKWFVKITIILKRYLFQKMVSTYLKLFLQIIIKIYSATFD